MIDLLFIIPIIAFSIIFIVAVFKFFFKFKLKNVWVDYEKKNNTQENEEEINNLNINEELFFEKFKNDKVFSDRLKLFFPENTNYIHKDVITGVAKELTRNGNFEKTNKIIENKKQGFWIVYYPNGSHNELPSNINDIMKDYDSLEELWSDHLNFLNSKSQLVTNVIKSKGNYIDNERDGLWKYYYKSGQIKSEVFYENDVEISSKQFEDNNEYGWATDMYYETGEIRRQSKFIDKRTQLFRSLHKNGKIELTWQHVDGIQSGEETEFDENGNIRAKRNYKQGKQYGESISYFENGNIEFIVNFSNGKPHGKATEFFNSNSDNNIKVIKYFKNGELNGPLTEYLENENIKRKNIYKGGELEGLQIEYYKTGQIREKGFFVNGLQHGRTLIYTEFGMIAKDQFYENDELIEEKNNIGELIGMISVGDELTKNSLETNNPKEVYQSFFQAFNLVFSVVQNNGDENLSNDSIEENSEYLKLCQDIENKLFNEIQQFSKDDYQTKYAIEKDVDINNYFEIICMSAWDHIVDFDFDPNNKLDWQRFEEASYFEIYAEVFKQSDEHIIKTLEPPLIFFIDIYNKLNTALKRTNELDLNFNITKSLYFKIGEFLLAHTHAIIYAHISLLQLKCRSYIEGHFIKAFKNFNLNESHYSISIASHMAELIKEVKSSEEIPRILEIKNEKEQDLAINDLYEKFGLAGINNLCCSFNEKKNYQKTIDVLLPKMDKKHKLYENTCDTLALAYYNLADYTNALHYSNLSIYPNSKSNSTSHYYNRARIYLKINEKEKAIIDLKKAIEKNGNEDAKNLLEEISNLYN